MKGQFLSTHKVTLDHGYFQGYFSFVTELGFCFLAAKRDMRLLQRQRAERGGDRRAAECSETPAAVPELANFLTL